jgi:prepilin-type processing-associated H-X9-DG protein
MAGFADRNKDGKFTTGAFDATRDGCPYAIGWVADMVNAKVCKPIELLCPSNPGQGSEKYKDILTDPTSFTGEAAPSSKQKLGICGGTMTATIAADNFMAKGYGTNHMTTWFLVRSAPQTVGSVSSGNGTITSTNQQWIKGLAGSKGPLKRRIVDQSPVTANVIPLMGDANVGDVQDRFLDSDLKGSDGTIYLTAGSQLVESFSDGPYFSGNGNSFGKWDTTQATIMTVVGNGTGSLPTIGGIAADEQPPKGTAKLMNQQLKNLQDYRDFGPVHGGSANVLFADGSVKVFQDLNGDTFLNPGFLTTSASSSGYAGGDNTVELPESEIFSGVLLENFNFSPKGQLD